MGTETALEGQETAVAPSEAALPAIAAQSDLAWSIVQMRAGERIVINEALNREGHEVRTAASVADTP